MLITFCLALLAAKLRHYRPGLLFRSWTIYPLLATECVYLLFQVFTLRGDYRFVPYASLLKTAYMLLFLIPMLVYRLYWQGIAGSGLIVAGPEPHRHPRKRREDACVSDPFLLDGLCPAGGV